MTGVYERLIRPVLFEHDSEEIHDFTLNALGRVSSSRLLLDAVESLTGAESLPIDCFGLRFPNPIGLAAGMDKRAAAVPVWEAMGFGFCELGGVTWHEQPGNPKPRMFRAVKEEALVNRMGFNNPGAAMFARKLAEWRVSDQWPKHPVGVNLGKSKITPLELAAEDYASSFRMVKPYADFVVVNVSSPNTPNLRKLQDKTALFEILNSLHELNRKDEPIPVLLKVAPDLTLEALDEILDVYDSRKVHGIVAANTTIERPETKDSQSANTFAETGGLSGRPLSHRSTDMIRHLYRQTGGKVPIVGVGGVFDADDAWDKITAGASLIQIYTGLVYRGPSVTREIVRGLRERLSDSGLKQLSDAVGIAT